MPSAKQDAEAMIHALPDDATFEDMQYRLYVLEKIHLGSESLNMEGGVPQDEARRRVAKWLEN